MEAGVKRKREPDHPRITYHAPGRTFDRLFKEESLRDLKDVVRKKLHVSSSNDIKLVQLRGNTEIDLEDDDDFDAFFSAAHHTSILNVRVIVAKGPQSEPSAVSVENSAVEDSGRNKELPKSVVSESQDEPGNPGATEKKRKEKENQSESTPHSQAESEHENRVEETVSTSSKDVEPPAKKRRVSFAAGDSESKKRRKKGKDKDSTTSEQGATLLPALPDQDSSSRPESLQDIAGKDAAITSLAPDTEQNKKRKQTDVNMSIPEKLGPTTSSERALKPKRKKRRKAGTDTDEDQSNPAPAPTEASTTESSNPLKQAGTIEKPQPKQKRGVTDANKPSTFEAQLASAVVEASDSEAQEE
ncbi:hypothetical protein BDQ17DRAFT_704042 [Cyathus striatus]|nr:hypothetical protein BDQ17DRAFT_704042 [Cyathus striatus]